ncbi:MAG: M36 family metallopeptidase, partial [Planctomycetota bacterium]
MLAARPDARVDWHVVLGSPGYIGSTARPLTQALDPANVDAIAIVTAFVDRHRELFGINPVVLATARMSRDFTTQHNQVRHLTFQQRRAGIDVFGASLRAGVTPCGQIVGMGTTLLDHTASGADAPGFTLSAADAIRLAAADAGLKITHDPVPLGTPVGPELCCRFRSAMEAAGPIDVRRVYFPLTATDLRPAWEVVLPESGTGNVYDILVDAADGTVLRRWNRLQRATTQDATYRVWVGDSPAPGSPGSDAPDGFQFPFVASELLTIVAGDIAPFSPAGWIDDGVNETQGNNVDAHTDLDNDDQPDLPRPTGDPYRVFDLPADPQTQNPPDFRDASVVQLFYLCNVFHDRLYELGFDEAAHNFQSDNFGNGGAGGDRIQADAQDEGGFNSSSFTTGVDDGSEARLEMHIFTNPAPHRDSDLDSELVFHELAHGVSTRLLGGLDGAQPQGLGEGWSDFLGIALNAEPDDDPHGTYPFGAYVAYQLWGGYDNNYYFGLRRFPYSTDPEKNPQTYEDIDPAQQVYPAQVPRNTNLPNTADEPHNAGEVWCTALMQCRANLIDRHGFAGNQLMMQLVIDGMKLSSSNPNYLQARDAILQADLVNNGGLNLGELWAGFAARGMGYS